MTLIHFISCIMKPGLNDNLYCDPCGVAFPYLISFSTSDTHFASMGVLAVGWVLHSGVNEGTVTWLDVEYTCDVDCDLFRCCYNGRW